jgi:MHS family proline/betaine transporter-like MFS transporter
MTAQALGSAANQPTRLRIRAVVAGSVGNLMEQYDNLIYAYSAVYIGQVFFAEGGTLTTTLATFGVFAVGFLARPVGTIFFGHLGDRYGRRPALIASVVLMGAATVLIGLLPGYATIGVAAPLLLTVLRLLQGFAVAGEWAGSTTMLVEYAPPHVRGRYGSFNQVSTVSGFLLAALVVSVNALLWPAEAMLTIGWRIPFLLGVLTMLIALLLRLGLRDTPKYEAEAQSGATTRNPLRLAFRTQKKPMLLGFCLNVGSGVGYYFFLSYLPTFLQQQFALPQPLVFASTLVGLVVMLVTVYAAGALSDRIGRKPTLLAGAGAITVLSWPVLALLSTGDPLAVHLAQACIGLMLGLLCGPIPTALAELFPTNVRYSALGIGFNFAIMAFGGTAGFIATGIIGATSSPLLVAVLPAAAALVSLVTILRMPETYRAELR